MLTDYLGVEQKNILEKACALLGAETNNIQFVEQGKQQFHCFSADQKFSWYIRLPDKQYKYGSHSDPDTISLNFGILRRFGVKVPETRILQMSDENFKVSCVKGVEGKDFSKSILDSSNEGDIIKVASAYKYLFADLVGLYRKSAVATSVIQSERITSEMEPSGNDIQPQLHRIFRNLSEHNLWRINEIKKEPISKVSVSFRGKTYSFNFHDTLDNLSFLAQSIPQYLCFSHGDAYLTNFILREDQNDIYAAIDPQESATWHFPYDDLLYSFFSIFALNSSYVSTKIENDDVVNISFETNEQTKSIFKHFAPIIRTVIDEMKQFGVSKETIRAHMSIFLIRTIIEPTENRRIFAPEQYRRLKDSNNLDAVFALGLLISDADFFEQFLNNTI